MLSRLRSKQHPLPAHPGDASTYQLVYDEAIRALDHQYDSLKEIRGRATTQIIASSAIAAFFAQAIFSSTITFRVMEPTFLLLVVAVASLLPAVALPLWVLRAQDDWKFVYQEPITLIDWIEKPDGCNAALTSLPHLQRALVVEARVPDIAHNATKIDALARWLKFASLALLGQVLLWSVLLVVTR